MVFGNRGSSVARSKSGRSSLEDILAPLVVVVSLMVLGVNRRTLGSFRTSLPMFSEFALASGSDGDSLKRPLHFACMCGTEFVLLTISRLHTMPALLTGEIDTGLKFSLSGGTGEGMMALGSKKFQKFQDCLRRVVRSCRQSIRSALT